MQTEGVKDRWQELESGISNTLTNHNIYCNRLPQNGKCIWHRGGGRDLKLNIQSITTADVSCEGVTVK